MAETREVVRELTDKEQAAQDKAIADAKAAAEPKSKKDKTDKAPAPDA